MAQLAQESRQSMLGRITSLCVYLFEQIMPDPYVFALILTFTAVLLAYFFAPHASPREIVTAWYGGVFGILTFAFQMVMMLVAGYAFARARPIQKGLEKIASLAHSPSSAVSLTVIVSLITSWLNWSLGLVAAALLAREIAKKVRIDFGWLVAAAYSGFVVSTEGLSGSIALSQATHGSALNVVEKLTGQLTPLSQTVFTRFNLIPIAVLFVALPIIFRYIGPDPQHFHVADPVKLQAEDQEHIIVDTKKTIATRLDRAWILTVLLAALAVTALVQELTRTKGSLDLNSVILTLFLGGLLLHWTPVAYVAAVRHAARVTGPLVLQYPLYGGLMGIMTTTGLAGVISKVFLRFATAHTLPFWTYMTSLVITLFVPSGGGHWAVQGPFAVPAAVSLGASLPATTMAVAMGESVANMLQPFWALPILAIAGIPMRRMMGFMVITFCVSLLVFGLSLVFLIPVQ